MSTVQIRVSADRAEQLRQLAEVRQLGNIGALLDVLVLEAIHSGEIADQTPGIIVRRDHNMIRLSVDGVAIDPMDEDEAETVAECLDGLGKRSMVFVGPASRDIVESGPVGRGFELKVHTPNGKAARTFTPPVARDVARQIRATFANPGLITETVELR